VAALLSGGADASAEDSQGWTPLMLAAKRGHTDVVRLLCEKGAGAHTGCEHAYYAWWLHDLNPSTKQQVRLWGLVRRRAAENGYAEILALLYDHCADRCPKCGDSYPNRDTLLICAILWGYFDVAKVLLDRRIAPDSPTEDEALPQRYFNQIALSLAVRGNDERIVRLLRERIETT
jgi:ankyrin repeat protein